MSRDEISQYRRRLKELLLKIEKRAFFCAHTDQLIQGVASEVYRRCGTKNCKCKNDKDRHGPYLVVQLYENKKQRQVALRKEEKGLWEQVKNYQEQMHSLLELKKSCKELSDVIEEIIERRLVKMGEVRCKRR